MYKLEIKQQLIYHNMNTPQTPPPPPKSYDYGIPPRPKSWLIWSVLATLICCNLLGIVGIVNAIRVNSLYDQTKYDKAKQASKRAKTWTLITFGVTGFFLLMFIITMVAAGSLSSFSLPSIGGEPLYF